MRSGGTAGGRIGGGTLTAGLILLASGKPFSPKVGASATVGLLCGGFIRPASPPDGSALKDGVLFRLGALPMKGLLGSSGTSSAKVSLFFSTLGVFFVDGTG